MSAPATTEKKYLKWYQKLAYGSGDLASNCSYGLVSSFVLLYLTGTLGLDSAIIGSLMLASKVLDGISDVIFGTLIDRTHSKLGKARPWMLFGQVGVSLCLFLLFAIPAGSWAPSVLCLQSSPTSSWALPLPAWWRSLAAVPQAGVPRL